MCFTVRRRLNTGKQEQVTVCCTLSRYCSFISLAEGVLCPGASQSMQEGLLTTGRLVLGSRPRQASRGLCSACSETPLPACCTGRWAVLLVHGLAAGRHCALQGGGRAAWGHRFAGRRIFFSVWEVGLEEEGGVFGRGEGGGAARGELKLTSAESKLCTPSYLEIKETAL